MKITEPRIIYMPAFRVAGIPLEGEADTSSLDAVWEKLAERFGEIPQQILTRDSGFTGLSIRGTFTWQDWRSKMTDICQREWLNLILILMFTRSFRTGGI